MELYSKSLLTAKSAAMCQYTICQPCFRRTLLDNKGGKKDKSYSNISKIGKNPSSHDDNWN